MIPNVIKNKIVAEANWRSTNGHGGVDDITRDNFILAAEFGYSLAGSEGVGVWVSVKKELPSIFKKVLAYSKSGDIQITCRDASKKFDDYPFKEGDKVTHWMPLPNPPKP